MIAYKKQSLDNLKFHQSALQWLKHKLITREEYVSILANKITSYHHPNIFSRIGMFILTCIVITSVMGFAATAFSVFRYPSLSLILITTGCFLATEFFIRERNLYRSGITDALIYSGLLSASGLIINIIDRNRFDFAADPLVYLFCLLPLFIICTIRYTDAFLALISFVLIILINALLVLKTGLTGKIILPFESMIISYLIYYFVSKQKAKIENRYWMNCLTMVEMLSLCTLYLSGNYFVVRQLTEALLGVMIEPGSDIQFAFLFYAFTIVVPVIYIWRGLKSRDIILIRCGLLLEIAGILSIKYYHSFLPKENAMILAGLAMIGIAWAAIRYLKSPRHGITYQDGVDRSNETMEIVSSFAVAQATNTSHTGEKPRFGGGESGGGGAGGNY